MKHNAVDIVLICIIVVLVLACVAASVLGYYTLGWKMWDLSEESAVRIIEDDSLSIEIDADQQHGDAAIALTAGEGYAITSAENDGYIEKSFVPLYCWPSKFDMWQDIEWSISYDNEYTKEKLAMRLDDTHPNLVWLECTGVFWNTATVTAAAGDLSATCSVRYEPVYLGLGVGAVTHVSFGLISSGNHNYSPIVESAAPLIDNTCTLYCGTADFPTSSEIYNIKIGLLNHFGEVELITQDGRSVWQDSEVVVPELPDTMTATYHWYHEANDTIYDIYNAGFSGIHDYDKTLQEEYDIIKQNSLVHDKYSVNLRGDNNLPEGAPSFPAWGNFQWGHDWDPERDIVYDPISGYGAITRGLTQFIYRGTLSGDHWRDDDYYGITSVWANGKFDDNNHDWVTEPFYYVGFERIFPKIVGVQHIDLFNTQGHGYFNDCSAWYVDITDVEPITVSIAYGDYTLDVVFDFSKAEELV